MAERTLASILVYIWWALVRDDTLGDTFVQLQSYLASFPADGMANGNNCCSDLPADGDPEDDVVGGGDGHFVVRRLIHEGFHCRWCNPYSR